MSEIEERIRRLREIQYDLMVRISTEQASLMEKRNRLAAIQQRINEILSRDHMTRFMMLGVLGKLMGERDRLMAEIRREMEMLDRLNAELKRVQDEIILLQQSRGMMRQVMRPPGAEAGREAEVRWLLEELKAIELGIVPDGRNRARILRRLRELGYPI